MKPKVRVTDNPDCTISLELEVSGCPPVKGRGLRSLIYCDQVEKAGDTYVYLKVWKKVGRAVRNRVVLQYSKERLMRKSPKIV